MTEDMPSGAFARRLTLLEESGQIGAPVRRLTEEIVADVERAFSVALDEEEDAFFVTHLALALARMERGEAEQEAPAVMEAEAAPHVDERRVAEQLLEQAAAALGRTAPRPEILYVTLYLAAIAGRGA
jgi:transcriptional regulatory protein LevR